MPPKQPDPFLTRRSVLRHGTLLLAGGAMASQASCNRKSKPKGGEPNPAPGSGGTAIETGPIRLGFLTDIHYADKRPGGTRHYRDSMAKMQAAVTSLNTQNIDAAIELGDLIDSVGTLEGEIAHLKAIDEEYAKLNAPRHYVLGNHCVHLLTKDEFTANCGMTSPHHAFDLKGTRFIVLDACFTSGGEAYERENFHWADANLPDDQLQWLEAKLASATGPVVVFTHQRIDGLDKPHNVNNGQQARDIINAAGNVLLVMSGHSHQNLHQNINGTDYVVARAMVEEAGLDNNAYGLLTIEEDHSLSIEGFAQQDAHSL